MFVQTIVKFSLWLFIELIELRNFFNFFFSPKFQSTGGFEFEAINWEIVIEFVIFREKGIFHETMIKVELLFLNFWRLLRLYEGRQYREAASFLLRLPRYTFKASLPDIPVDLIVESLPHSLSLLEAVYARLLDLVQSNDSCIDDAMLGRIEHQVLWRIVHHISRTENLRDAQIWSKLLVTLSRLSPGSKKLLASRRRSLERAVEGLGKHGLVPSNTNVENRRWSSTTTTTTTTTMSASRSRFIGFGFGNAIQTGVIPGRNINNSCNSLITTAITMGQNNTTIAHISPGEAPTTLLPLTAKLRDELETRLEAYKLALHKIESWGKQNGGVGGGVGVGVGVGGTRSKGMYIHLFYASLFSLSQGNTIFILPFSIFSFILSSPCFFTFFLLISSLLRLLLCIEVVERRWDSLFSQRILTRGKDTKQKRKKNVRER